MAKDGEDRCEDEDGGDRCKPKKGQIRPGEVRNQWGRKGKPRAQIDFLDETIEVRIDGQPRKVTRDEAIDFALWKEAVEARSVSAAKELDRRRRAREAVDVAVAEDATLTPGERQALERHVQRRLEQIQAGAETPSNRPLTASVNEGQGASDHSIARLK